MLLEFRVTKAATLASRLLKGESVHAWPATTQATRARSSTAQLTTGAVRTALQLVSHKLVQPFSPAAIGTLVAGGACRLCPIVGRNI